MISHLKQQIEKLRDYKEQVIVLKAERQHLEDKVKTLNEKVKYLSTPVCNKRLALHSIRFMRLFVIIAPSVSEYGTAAAVAG